MANVSTYFRDARNAEQAVALSHHQSALERCIDRLRQTMPVMGLRNPKIGRPDNSWTYCEPYDWVVSFLTGQYWLAFSLTGDPVFQNAARARRGVLRGVLRNRLAQDHDLGFQFSLGSVGDWVCTSDPHARDMALEAASLLLSRYHPEGSYFQAWNAQSIYGAFRPEFANGRIIADTMQNLALLYWASKETSRADYEAAANGHAETSMAHLIRADDTTYHTFAFDPSDGQPIGGKTHQGYADDSCWARGQAWMIHGFAQSALTTGNLRYVDAARRLAIRAEHFMGQDPVPVWDYSVPSPETDHRDSSAAAIMAAGVYILADLCKDEEAQHWRGFGKRLVDGLLDTCDLTRDPDAHGLLSHGAAHVKSGFSDNMLPYGDYYFMEALMRSLGHRQFFW